MLREFIEKSKKIHGDKYDYSKVEYINNKTKVCIICPVHGEFWQRPHNHTVQKQGCPYCKNEKTKKALTMTQEEFLEKARFIHGDKYDYSNTVYKNYNTSLCIVCPEHGEFWMRPNNHISQKQGCPKCAGKIITTKDFIEKSHIIHNHYYDYSKVEYTNNHTKVCIICPEHGEFWQTPHDHLDGHGCIKCGGIAKKDTEQFIKEAINVHGDKYDYSQVKYINNRLKVKIICHKTDKNGIEHGEFWQTPYNHVGLKQECPLCMKKKNRTEKNLYSDIKNIFPSTEYQKKFQWLGLQSLDIFIPEYNIAIEYQGEQHFYPIKFFGGEDKLIIRKKLDKNKKEMCDENGIKLLYIVPEQIYNNIEKYNTDNLYTTDNTFYRKDILIKKINYMIHCG